MEMHQIRYFLAAAEDGNFTRAAERCSVSQPTMTRAIKTLENQLGGSLFHRDRSPMQLTELGRMMMPYLQQIYAQATEAKQRAQEFSSSDRISLRLGIMCTIAPTQLVPLFIHLGQEYNRIELQLTDAAIAELRSKLNDGRLDAAIMSNPDAVPENHHSIPLYREQFMIAVGQRHRLAQQDVVRVRDLAGENYLDRIKCEYGTVADRIFAEQGVTDRTVYKSDRDDWILALAAAGMGYAFIPAHSAIHFAVAARPLTEPEIWREISLVTVRGRPHSAPLGALVREAARHFRQHASGTGDGPDADNGADSTKGCD